MPRDRLWTPTIRCVRCRRIALRDAVRAFLFQPVTPDGGRVHFECRTCRPSRERGRGSQR
jgi:hypothetical protein